MHHLNYCRQITNNLLLRKKETHRPNDPEMEEEILRLVDRTLNAIKVSQKFLLPDFGFLVEDKDLRAIDETQKLRLPYPVIALEFFHPHVDEHKPPLLPNMHELNKIVILAYEADDIIVFTQVNYIKERDAWVPYPEICIHTENYIKRKEDGTLEVFLSPLKDIKRFSKSLTMDLYLYGVKVFFNFLNILYCSNVHVEKSPPKKSFINQKKNTLPFDAYHILSIDTVIKNETHTKNGSTHASPREHLRRGHIRKLQDGRRIWVNAAIVNAGIGGKIFKDYAL